jgi:hypothetical protein
VSLSCSVEIWSSSLGMELCPRVNGSGQDTGKGPPLIFAHRYA